MKKNSNKGKTIAELGWVNSVSLCESIWIGIDVGYTGGVAVIDDEKNIHIYDTPLLVNGDKNPVKVYDFCKMHDILDRYKKHDSVYVGIERQNAFPGQGVVSMFHLGEGYGAWQGIVASCGYKFRLVSPISWKRGIFGKDGTDKTDSRRMAMKLFPSCAKMFERVKDHGRADSALIAEFVRRIYSKTDLLKLY